MIGNGCAVFLDRDGVLNRAILRNGVPHPPSTLHDFEILVGVPEAVYRLRQAGFAVVVVTNQPDVARGTQSPEVVDAMHAALRDQISPDAIMICYHDDRDRCTCRKPKPGMLESAANELNLDLSRSFMVGDRWRDIEAGKRAGCRTVFIDLGYSERQPEQPDATVENLTEAVTWILASVQPKEQTVA